MIDRIKAYFKGSEIFAKLVENAVKKRIEELPKIDHEITRIQNALNEVEEANRDLREQLREKDQRSRASFMNWLEEEVEKIKEQKTRKEQDLEILFLARADLMKKSGLEELEKTALEFIARFDQLTGVQKRSFIERMISRVVIKKDNRLELHVLWDASSARRKSYVGDPSTSSFPSLCSGNDSARDDVGATNSVWGPSATLGMISTSLENDENLINGVYYKGQKKVVTRTTILATGSSRERGGGPSTSLLELLCRPYEVVDVIEFQHCPPYHDKIVLHQKYIVECLSIRQIARKFSSSKEAVRVGLKRAGIELRKAHLPHGRQSQAKFGERRVHGTVMEFKKEEKVVKAVKQMKEQGLSLRQIAKNLSAMGIPTKCDGMKWHPEMVKRVLRLNGKCQMFE